MSKIGELMFSENFFMLRIEERQFRGSARSTKDQKTNVLGEFFFMLRIEERQFGVLRDQQKITRDQATVLGDCLLLEIVFMSKIEEVRNNAKFEIFKIYQRSGNRCSWRKKNSRRSENKCSRRYFSC